MYKSYDNWQLWEEIPIRKNIRYILKNWDTGKQIIINKENKEIILHLINKKRYCDKLSNQYDMKLNKIIEKIIRSKNAKRKTKEN